MKADLHLHTYHSEDNAQRVETIFARAKEEGLGAIAITDHNTMAGCREAMKKRPEWLIIVPGIEISTSEGHILAYGLATEVPRDRSPAETIELVHQRGGIAVAAHPYRFWSGLSERAIRANRFDATEAFNARNTARSNRRAAALAKEKGDRITAGSDSHERSTVARGYAVIPDDVTSPEGVIAAIMEGRLTYGGRSRPPLGSVGYAVLSVLRWLLRGMKRI